MATVTAHSNRGSCPYRTAAGCFQISMSGATLCFRVGGAGRVAEVEVGSGERTAILSGGNPTMPTGPPQVRVPTNGATLWKRKQFGMASPPDPRTQTAQIR
ncbi:hypothetical protein MMRN_31320 [Mycobacterium marinum]|uniref:hypothetical protein n=1 Tax=Mycobacterium marinum TaxID=1781 RepID=UPI00056AA801|nr:hypothetical protein [Mycobacterium marinum]AXN50317.1 hypothetical protein CCUG20998_02912 [Mycobacterium marinum]RFZ22162.1 hypothetical protein DSM43519_03364 [Mycobacterium marinum]RFZ25714.1 hypothetical protein DSM44344_02456 [Mycobacterium marinum]RFZ38206.1 hypothetical protein NCTC2275_00846 [Mycobacterium marinum]WOR02474.1 hypothetical protein QDR78_14400 [Mycobacterium marinum]